MAAAAVNRRRRRAATVTRRRRRVGRARHRRRGRRREARAGARWSGWRGGRPRSGSRAVAAVDSRRRRPAAVTRRRRRVGTARHRRGGSIPGGCRAARPARHRPHAPSVPVCEGGAGEPGGVCKHGLEGSLVRYVPMHLHAASRRWKRAPQLTAPRQIRPPFKVQKEPGQESASAGGRPLEGVLADGDPVDVGSHPMPAVVADG